MKKEELDKVIEIISTHTEHDGDYCDTGEDMDWACRSDCVKMAIKRLREYFNENSLEKET